MSARAAVPRLDVRLARLLAVGLGLGLLTLGSGAGAARAAPSQDQLVGVALSNGRTISRWAYARTAGIVRRGPSRSAARVGQLHFLTADGQAEVYMALRETRIAQSGVAWIEVTLPQRPNGVTGWVEASALDPLHVVGGYLLVSRSSFARRCTTSPGACSGAPLSASASVLAHAGGSLLRGEKLRAVKSPGVWAICDRDQRLRAEAQRVARRRHDRHPRDRPASAGPGRSLPRVRAHAQPRYHSPVAPHRDRHTGRHHVTASSGRWVPAAQRPRVAAGWRSAAEIRRLASTRCYGGAYGIIAVGLIVRTGG